MKDVEQRNGRGKLIVVAVVFSSLLSIGALWYVAGTLGSLRAGQAQSLDLLSKVLRRIKDMTTFSEDVTTLSGRVVNVSTTCREGETLEDCWQRHSEAVALVAASR